VNTVDLVVLGALVVAVASLSAGVAVTAATNRELRGQAARWESAAWAFRASGDVADAVRVTGQVRLVDGTVRTVADETIGQVLAPLPGRYSSARAIIQEGQQDPWTPGPSGSI
jgi:hypothetical protein